MNNDKKNRTLVIAGSSRSVTNCPAADSKASFFWGKEVIKFVENKGKVKQGKYSVPLQKPDSQMHPFLRQLQLLVRLVIGNLWMHSYRVLYLSSSCQKTASL